MLLLISTILVFVILSSDKMVIETFALSNVNNGGSKGSTCHCSWKLHGNKLTISGKGEMENYSGSRRAPWGNGIKTVVIENGVTGIGNYAFYGCEILTSVTIPKSVIRIGDYAFHFCQRLTSVNIPGGVRSIGENAFSYCESLTSVTIPNSVEYIGDSAFEQCDLRQITIPESVALLGQCAFGYNLGEIEDDFIGIRIQRFMIRGKKGTAAEIYSYLNGFTFVPIHVGFTFGNI